MFYRNRIVIRKVVILDSFVTFSSNLTIPEKINRFLAELLRFSLYTGLYQNHHFKIHPSHPRGGKSDHETLVTSSPAPNR